MDFLFYSFPVSGLFAFGVLGHSVKTSSNSESSLSYDQSTKIPLKAFFIPQCLLSLSFLFFFFSLEFSSLFLSCRFVLMCCLLYSLELSILIIVVLDPQCDHSNISALSDSGSDACSISLNCVFTQYIMLGYEEKVTRHTKRQKHSLKR